MNFSDVLKTLNQASSFELYRMRAAIDKVLDEPRRLMAIHAKLRIGQDIEYFDLRANAQRRGKVLELRSKQAVILDEVDRKRWLISYVALNLEGVDVQISEQVHQGLGCNEVAVGDTVGFLDTNQQQRSGQIIRLNDKTVTLMCGQQQWRVAYAYLHRVVDGMTVDHHSLELDVTAIEKNAVDK